MSKGKTVVDIHDMPEYPVTNPWLVVKYDKLSQSLKFCQSFDSKDKADEAVKMIYNGLVVRNYGA